MSYTYHISLNGSDYTQVYPKEGIQATKEPVTGCIFHREGVSEVSLTEADNATMYASLEAYYIDGSKYNDQLEFEVYDGTRTGTAYFYGMFSISDCQQDHEKKVISFTPRINDDYMEVLDHFDDKYNAYNIFNTSKIGKPTDVTIVWNADSPGATYGDFDTWTEGASAGIITSCINLAGDAARYQTIGSVTSGDIIILYIKAYTKNSGTNVSLQFWDGSDNDIANEAGGLAITGTGFYALSTSSTTTGYLGIYAADAFNGSFTVEIWDILSGSDLKTFACDTIINAVETFLTDAAAMDIAAWTGKVKSTFLNNDALPSDAPSTIDTWITANSAGNYVTETTDNRLNTATIGIADKWDTLNNEHPLALSNLFSDLRDILQVYWYIDADGDLRLEHKMYFDRMVDDSTAITMASLSEYLPEADHLVTSFRKELIFSRETFSWAQATYDDTDFRGEPIVYDVFETSPQIKDYSLSRITTDLDYLTTNADASFTGLCYYDCFSATTLSVPRYIIRLETGEISSTKKLNAHFSWANLHINYWTWGRMSENATMNDSAETMDSVIKFLEHEGLRFYYATEIDWYNKITTSLGTGEILQAVRDFDSDFIELKIGYNPYE